VEKGLIARKKIAARGLSAERNWSATEEFRGRGERANRGREDKSQVSKKSRQRTKVPDKGGEGSGVRGGGRFIMFACGEGGEPLPKYRRPSRAET